MAAQVPIDENLLKQLQQTGELLVENTQGVPLVLMTVDARKQLQKVVLDGSDWSEEEQNAMLTAALDDPEGWGAQNMEVYDELYGGDSQADGKNQ